MFVSYTHDQVSKLLSSRNDSPGLRQTIPKQLTYETLKEMTISEQKMLTCRRHI